MSNQHVKLIIREGGPGLFFTYSTRSGREIIFKVEGNYKVAYIPLAEWRANHFALAIDLLEQHLHPPIIFDVVSDAGESTPIADPAKDETKDLITGLEQTIAALTEENEQLRNAVSRITEGEQSPESPVDEQDPAEPEVVEMEPVPTEPQASAPTPSRTLRKRQQPQDPDLISA